MQEQAVEIEATTRTHMGRLSYVIVELRKNESGDMVAVGKQ